MSLRTGRPTNEPRKNWQGLRLSDNDIEKLEFCVRETGMTKTDIIRKGIDLVYQGITKK